MSDKMRGVYPIRLTGFIAAAALACSCGGEPPVWVDASPPSPPDAHPDDPGEMADAAPADAGPSNYVFGNAYGLLGPVALELQYGMAPTEILTVAQDGSFAFQAEIPDGVPYNVRLAASNAPCELRDQTGTGGAIRGVQLLCKGASLTSVVLSGVEPVMIHPVQGTTEYEVDVAMLQQSVQVTATVAWPGDTLTIRGAKVGNGTPSQPMTLHLGDNAIDIVVDNSFGWQQTHRLIVRRAIPVEQDAYGKASNTGAGDAFGVSVSLSGDTLVVGAFHEDSATQRINGNQNDNSAEKSGAVYVFRRSGSTWQQEAYIKGSNTELGDRFGASVAVSGDTLAVGATFEDCASNALASCGAVYVFRRSGSTWQQEAVVRASSPQAGDHFGRSLALSGDTLVSGAPDRDAGGVVDSGAVFVFKRIGTAWSQTAALRASTQGKEDRFGFSVALSGDMLAVGAHLEDSSTRGINGNQADNTAADSGAVYVFRRSGDTWTQDAYVKASNTAAGDNFGYSVALSGETLAVGASGEDSGATGIGGDETDNTISNSGAVYVFRRTNDVWAPDSYLKASNTGASDLFGAALALWGDTLAVGAYQENSVSTGIDGDQEDDRALKSGAVYVFRHGDSGWQQDTYVKASNTGASDNFGFGVALSGDTLAVGAHNEDSSSKGINPTSNDSALDSGAAYIFH
jgi:hypothetical protein